MDDDTRKGLLAFIEAQEAKPRPHILRGEVAAWILKAIVDGDCRISGSATDHTKKIMYVEFTFYEDSAS